jgi:hypothetical protein
MNLNQTACLEYSGLKFKDSVGCIVFTSLKRSLKFLGLVVSVSVVRRTV